MFVVTKVLDVISVVKIEENDADGPFANEYS